MDVVFCIGAPTADRQLGRRRPLRLGHSPGSGGTRLALRYATSTRNQPLRPISCLALAGLCALAACQDVARRVFTPPVVRFRGLAVRSLGLNGGVVDVSLLLVNPNGYALSATGARYRLLVRDSTEVGRGAASDTVAVAAHDSATVRLPLAVSWRGLQAAGLDALGGGGVDYRIVGEIDAGTPIGRHTIPLDAHGRAALAPTR